MSAVRDVPMYLEAPDNEDSGALCECGEPAYDDGRYPDLCVSCNDEEAYDEYQDMLFEELRERDWDL